MTHPRRPSLLLRTNWLRRPYFGLERPGDPSAHGDQFQTKPEGWVGDGMRCTVLPAFLNERTAGLFLVAGPRGIGKTSLVRHWAHETNTPDLPVHVADAADLGLFDDGGQRPLERVLLEGLLRALCEAMIPLKVREHLFGDGPFARLRSFWDAMRKVGRHPKDDVPLWRDLYALAERGSADRYERTQAQDNSMATDLKGSAGLGRQVGPGKLSAKAGRTESWVSKRSTQAVWTNRTDALRAELRGLWRRHAKAHWPILVLDEWDRFGTEEAGSGPTADEVLKALARLKSLLADYPAAVVVVAGEEIYRRVRAGVPLRPRAGDAMQGYDLPPEEPADYANLFNQRCFLSPLPAWSQDKQEPLLYPYLSSLLSNGPYQCARDIVSCLAELLLFEVGPNPHGVKLWVGRNLSSDGKSLEPPWDGHAEFKVLMSRVISAELARWERDYGAVMTAGPYRRLIWLRYLRRRMYAYWSHARPKGNGSLCLPDLKCHQAELAPNEFLQSLEAAMDGPLDAPGKREDAGTAGTKAPDGQPGTAGGATPIRGTRDRTQIQRLDLDARLLTGLNDEVRRVCFERGLDTDKCVEDDETMPWDDWLDEGLLPWHPGGEDKADLLRGAVCYDLRVLAQ